MTDDNRGYVTPVAADGAEYMDPLEPTGRTLRSSVVAGFLVVAVVVAAIAGTLMWRSRNGDPFASARSIPADMEIVVTLDALALSDSARLQAFVDAFALPMVEAGMIDDYPEDLVAAIDTAMAAEGDFTLSGDFIPWVGRTVSLALTPPEFNPDTFEVGPVSLLVSADVRDHDAAEAFVGKVIAQTLDGQTVAAKSIAGYAGYVWEDPHEDLAVGIVLTEDTLLAGVEEDIVKAIEANRGGLSLADDATFRDVMGRLPDERMVSFYTSVDPYDQLFAMPYMLAGSTEETEDSPVFDAMAGAVSLIDEGLLFSYAVAGSEFGDVTIAPDLEMVGRLPAGTLGYLSAMGGDYVEQSYDELAAAGYDNVFSAFYDETGIDLWSVVESLTGDITFAAVETRDGAIANETDVPVGVVGAFGLTDDQPFLDLIANLEEYLAYAEVSLVESDGITTASGDGGEIFSFALNPDLMVLGTGRDIVAGITAGGEGGLLEADLYRELDRVVAGDGLVGYVDIPAIIDLIPMTREESAVFAPLRGVGVGGEASGGTALVEVVVLVDY